MSESSDTAQQVYMRTNQQIEALGGEERAALVQDLAAYIAAHPQPGFVQGLHKVAPLATFKSAVTASYPTAQLMFGNSPELIDYALYGWFATGIATINYAHKKTASPVAKLLHDAMTLAETMQNGKELPHRYALENIKPEDMTKNMRKDKLTAGAATYLNNNPELLQREKLQRKYGTLITGLALLSSVVATTDLMYNEGLRGPNDRSESEKKTHLVLDLTALAALGVGAVGYGALRRKFFGFSPTEKLISDAEAMRKELNEHGIALWTDAVNTQTDTLQEKKR